MFLINRFLFIFLTFLSCTAFASEMTCNINGLWDGDIFEGATWSIEQKGMIFTGKNTWQIAICKAIISGVVDSSGVTFESKPTYSNENTCRYMVKGTLQFSKDCKHLTGKSILYDDRGTQIYEFATHLKRWDFFVNHQFRAVITKEPRMPKIKVEGKFHSQFRKNELLLIRGI